MKTKKSNYLRKLSSIILPILFLIFWELISRRIGNEAVLPSVTTIGKHFLQPFADVIGIGSIPKNILYSLIRVFIGYILAILIGIPLGLLMGYFDSIRYLFENFLSLFKPVPAIAWRPLVLGWFGISSLATVLGMEYGANFAIVDNFKLSMIFLIVLGAFFPIWGNTMFGVANVRTAYIESAKVLGADQKDIFFHVLMPAAGPNIFNGLRSGLTAAWACLVAAEMLPGSMAGLGYLITHAYELSRMDLVIVGIICIGFIGAGFDAIFRVIADKYFSWQRNAK